MTTPPQTRYAKSGGVHIAYQVVGDGPFDLVLIPGLISHVELAWEEPAIARFLRRLASFSRLILFDKRGTGLSDPVPLNQLPTLEQRMDDVRSVMDAVGSERAALFGVSEGGPMAFLFAATYPQRTTAVVLYGEYARMAWAPDYPWGFTLEQHERLLQRIDEGWGTGDVLKYFAPDSKGDERLREWWARLERQAASPGTAMALLRMAYEIDARSILPTVSVPTLVVHRSGDRLVPVEHGRYVAEHIRGAKYVELPGRDHLYWTGDAEVLLGEVQEFLTGVRPSAELDRVLATVLFTDIVGSSERAAELGDRRWRDLLENYYGLVRRQLERFRGREIDTAGDGLFATFDGPARAIRCASAVTAGTRQLGIEVRAGVHTGECEVIGDKVGGIAVHTGARVAAMANAGEVLVSHTVKDLVAGSGIRFEDRGAHALKGIPGEWRLFAALSEAS
jgi:pimeloyl-ACP methyl ester carboxylesterase